MEIEDVDRILGIIDKPKNTKKKNVISDFSGDFEFLSTYFSRNQTSLIFYEEEDDSGNSSIVSCYETVPTLEHLYQMNKTVNRKEQLLIKNALTPGQAKRLGQRVTLIKNWDSKRLKVMENLIEEKFANNFDLKIKLLSLKDCDLKFLNSDCDEFWGKEKNQLGKILMKVRDRIEEQEGDLHSIISYYLSINNIGFVSDWIDISKAYVSNKKKESISKKTPKKNRKTNKSTSN